MQTATNKQTGFTLVELLITLTIAGILLGIGVPSFFHIIQSNRSATQINTLVNAINFARSSAMERNGAVWIGSHDSGTDWSDGWVVYVDTNDDGDYDDGEEIRLFDALPNSSTLTASQGRISLDDNGYVDDLRITQTITWALTQADCDGDLNRTLTLHQSGRSVVAQTTCP